MLARFRAHADAGLAAGAHQPLQALVVALAGHQHMVKAAPPGAQSLFHRVQSVKHFHGTSLEDAADGAD